MSERHPTPGQTGPDAAPPGGWAADSFLPGLRPELRPALLHTPAPARTGPDPPADWFDRLPDPPPAFDPAPDPADPIAAAALGCPDLFLIAGPPGPARDHLLRSLADGATRRGERVLLLAPTPAAADRLARLLDTAVRALAPGERPDDLPADLSGRASAARGAELAAAGDAADELRLRAERDAVPAAVAAEAAGGSALAAELRLMDAAHEVALAGIDAGVRTADAERAARQAELVGLRERVKQLAPLAEARKGLRVLSGRYWRSVFAGDVAGRLAELERKVRDAEAAVRDHDEWAERRDADRAAAAARHAEARAAAVRAEVARRQAALDARLAAADEFRRVCGELAAAGITPPGAPTTAAVAAATAESAAARRQDEAGLAFARGRLAELAAEGEDAAARRFLARVPLVVAPAAAVPADSAVAAGRFDRLLVEAAEQVPDADLRAAARRADRGVLSGCPGDDDDQCVTQNGRACGNRGALMTGAFGQLWGRLHRPVWAVERGRLVCRLADVGRGPLACEPCADRPEVELRFGTGPGGEPVVAEIAFPADAAADAKAFLARELGEVRLNPRGPAKWDEAGGRLAVAWPAAGAGGFGVPLEPGVWEYAVAVDGVPVTTRVTFDPAAGWNRTAAEAWVARHTAAARAERTARLPAGGRVAEPAEACLVG